MVVDAPSPKIWEVVEGKPPDLGLFHWHQDVLVWAPHVWCSWVLRPLSLTGRFYPCAFCGWKGLVSTVGAAQEFVHVFDYPKSWHLLGFKMRCLSCKKGFLNTNHACLELLPPVVRKLLPAFTLPHANQCIPMGYELLQFIRSRRGVSASSFEQISASVCQVYVKNYISRAEDYGLQLKYFFENYGHDYDPALDRPFGEFDDAQGYGGKYLSKEKATVFYLRQFYTVQYIPTELRLHQIYADVCIKADGTWNMCNKFAGKPFKVCYNLHNELGECMLSVMCDQNEGQLAIARALTMLRARI